MTIQELISKLQEIPNKESEVSIKHGCLIAGNRIIIDEED